MSRLRPKGRVIYEGREVLRNVLLVVEMAHEEPDIRFDTISDSSGMETIEKARSHADEYTVWRKQK